MSAKKGRPVIVKIKVDQQGAPVIVEKAAQFHCWGNRPVKNQQVKAGVMTETVGICELVDGSIRLVLPERIRFLDVEKK